MSASKNIKIVGATSVKDLIPDVPAYARNLMPKSALVQQEFSFELHGANIAIANGLRRVIESGVLVKSLFAAQEDIESNDPFVIPEYIAQRIRLIPCRQNVPLSAIFAVDLINNTADIMEVLAGNILGENNEAKSAKTPYFDDTITLTDLNPNKFLKIKKITVMQGRGYDYGGFTVAHGCVCLPLDKNLPEKMSSSVSDVRDHLIRFQTNGTEKPEVIVKNACEEMIERLKTIDSKLATHLHTQGTANSKIHRLVIEGEDDTTGNILMKTILDIEPDISACVYTVNSIDKNMQLEIRHLEPKHLISRAIYESVQILNAISKQIM